ncbi:MAG: hypothetical protein ABIQ52_05095 [Vicinamibacterales bacterium]
MTFSLKTVPLLLLCSTSLAVMSAPASAQQAAPAAPAALGRVKAQLDHQPARRLAPSGPLELRPVFKSRVDRRPFVLTLEQDLHKTFDLNDLQRQSADWSSRCCGLDLGALFRSVDKAMDERRLRKTREQIAQELAFVEAAAERAAAAKTPAGVAK